MLDVGVVQAGELTEDLEGNLARLGDLVRRAAADLAPDLIVMPELITTPYFCVDHAVDRTPWAEPVPGPSTGFFGALARELGVAIAYGMYERTSRQVAYNSVVIVGADGAVVPWHTPDGGTQPAYRKLSLPACWASGVDVDEKYWFAPGGSPAYADLFGTRIAAVACYDRSFPEYWAVARAMGAEVVLVIASSLGSREDLFLAELQTRALESQAWVVAANRAGVEKLGDSAVDYFGLSCVIRPGGEIVARAPAHEAGVTLRAQLDLDESPIARSKIPLARDKRPDVFRTLAGLISGDITVPPIAGKPR
jgi:beta-ureidopropionase